MNADALTDLQLIGAMLEETAQRMYGHMSKSCTTWAHEQLVAAVQKLCKEVLEARKSYNELLGAIVTKQEATNNYH